MAPRRTRETWEYREKELLVDLIAKYELQKSNSKTASKHASGGVTHWNVIHKEFCKLSGRTRDLNRLKQQWLRIKQNAKWTITQSIHRETLRNNPKFKVPTGSELEPDELSLKIEKLFPEEFSRLSNYYSVDMDKIYSNFHIKTEDVYDPEYEPDDNIKSNGNLKTFVHNKLKNGIVYKQVRLRPPRKSVSPRKLTDKEKMLKNLTESRNHLNKSNCPDLASQVIEDKNNKVRYIINIPQDADEPTVNAIQEDFEHSKEINVVQETTVAHKNDIVIGPESEIENPLNEELCKSFLLTNKCVQTDNSLTNFDNVECFCRHKEYILQEKKLNEEIKQMKELHALRLKNETELQKEKISVLRLKRQYWEVKLKSE